MSNIVETSVPERTCWPALRANSVQVANSFFALHVAEAYEKAALAEEHPSGRHILCANGPAYIWDAPIQDEQAKPAEIFILNCGELVLVENLLAMSKGCVLSCSGSLVTLEFVGDQASRIICEMHRQFTESGCYLRLQSIEIKDQRERLT